MPCVMTWACLKTAGCTRSGRAQTGSWAWWPPTRSVSVASLTPNAAPLDVVYYKRPIEVQGIVRGTPVENGIDAWYVVGPGQYVSAAYVDPLVLHTPPQTFGGHWIDVNLSQFYATAYSGDDARVRGGHRCRA